MDAIYAWMWWQQAQAGRAPVTPSQVRDTQNWLDGVLAERLREEAGDGAV